MLKERNRVIQTVSISLDAALVSFVFILTCLIESFDARPASVNDYVVTMFLNVMLWCSLLSLNGMYRSMRTRSFLEVAWIIIKTAFFTALIFGAFVFLFKLQFISRLFLTIFILGSSGAVGLQKMIVFSILHIARRQGYNYRRMLIVGTSPRAANFISKIRSHPEWGYKILGVIDDGEEHAGDKVSYARIIGGLKDIPEILHNNPVDEVVFIVSRSKLNSIENSLYICESAGIRPTLALDLFELKLAKARQTELEGIPLITFETTPAREWGLFLKRMADIVISGVGLIILSPVFLIVAILIKATSRGPVMFLQKRMGLNGRRFILYKFRTMRKGAHRKLSELKALNIMNGPVFKMKDDPRITPVGRFLRKFSIDELPQLFNVLLGHMSLVGPRPAIPQEVVHYEHWQRRRLSMRPGITCIWQISGRNDIDFEEWIKLDLQYIDNWSPWLDFKILVKTIPAVLFGIGAY